MIHAPLSTLSTSIPFTRCRASENVRHSSLQLRLGERVTLRGANAAVFSWEGAKLELSGDGAGAMAYLSDETPMPHYLNLHDALEARRRRAFSQNGAGPRICIVGPTDSGKSTLCRMLGSWAARSAWHPVLVDVDIGQGSTTVPGTVSSVVLESPIDIEEGVPLEAPLGNAPARLLPSTFQPNLPLQPVVPPCARTGRILHSRSHAHPFPHSQFCACSCLICPQLSSACACLMCPRPSITSRSILLRGRHPVRQRPPLPALC